MNFIVAVTALGDYRLSFVKALKDKLGTDLVIYSGTRPFDETVKTLTPASAGFVEVKNRYFLKHRLLWQSGGFFPCLVADGLVLDLNPRVLNVWVLILLRKLLGKNTVLWGHAWSRTNTTIGISLRKLMRNFADALIVYTETQKNEVILGEGGVVFSAPNALYRRDFFDEVSSEFQTERSSFVYVGRLVSEKKPRLLIEAFISIIDRLPPDVILNVVGDGPERDLLTDIVISSGYESRVRFFGHVIDPIQLKNIYKTAIASVSPGYVGLSITQSFAFGVPMIISKDEPHAPEIEAAVLGINCDFFDTDEVASLGSKLLEFYLKRKEWLVAGQDIKMSCRDKYSAEVMADGVVNALLFCRDSR